MVLRLATLGLAQALDFATFLVMVRHVGPAAEANPLVSSLLETLGLPAVALAKVALVVLVACLVVVAAGRSDRRWAAIGGLPLALAISAGLIGGITNAAAFLG